MQKTVVLVGLGYQSTKVHLPAILNSKQLRLIGVVEIDIDRAKSMPELENTPVFSTVEEMLLTIKPDLAVVVLPHHLHFEVTQKLLNQGINVLKEKPLAINVRDAKKLVELAKEKEVLLGVNTQRRLYPHFLRLSEYVERVGKVRQIVGNYHFFVDLGEHWRDKKKYSGGGVVLDMGYHMIDVLISCFGMPKTILCQLDEAPNSSLTESSASIIFTYKNGIFGNIYLSKSNPPYKEELKIVGDQGMLIASESELELFDLSGNSLEKIAYQFVQPISSIEYFGLTVDQKVPNLLSAELNLDVMNFIEICYQSWQKKQIIAIPSNKKKTVYLPQSSFTDQLFFNNNLLLEVSGQRKFSIFFNKLLDKLFLFRQRLLDDENDYRLFDYQFNLPTGKDFFENKVALITGASSGIGLATAKLLNQLGAKVIMVSSGKNRLKKAQELLVYPENSNIFNYDLADEQEINKLVAKVEREIKKIDFFVHCAGVSKSMSLKSEKSEGFDDDWNINAKSFYLILLKIQKLIRPNGAIVSIASIRARGGSPTGIGYAAAKAGVISIAQSAALQLADQKIRVNCVVPGATYPTQMSANWPAFLIQKIIANIPLKKMATPEEIAYVIKFLLSNESSHITGQAIDVNGGEVMR